MWRPILLLVAAVGCLGAPNKPNPFAKPTHSNPFVGGIVGGELVSIEKVPYQLSLEDKKRNVCGASVIGEHWAITAAHCVYGLVKPDIIELRSGSSTKEKGGVLHQAKIIKVHEKYNATIFDYDVALIRVNEPFKEKEIISLAKVRPTTGTNTTISGWGRIQEDGPFSEELRWVHVPIFDQEKCKAIYGDTLTDRMLCAGYPQGGKDSCQGDSGGPMVVGQSLVGIVSKGKGCARKEPGVYTDVAAVHEWIEKIVGSYVDELFIVGT